MRPGSLSALRCTRYGRLGGWLIVLLLGMCLLAPGGSASTRTHGSELWVSRYDGSPDFETMAYSVAVSPDGSRVFITGTSARRSTDWDYVTIAYRASTGARLWMRRFDGLAKSQDYADSVVVSPDGSRVFVTGTSYGNGTDDYATVAYRASDGSRLWKARYDGAHEQDYAASIAASADGRRVFVAGTSEVNGEAHFATVAYGAASGVPLWTRRYGGRAHSDDWADSLALSPDGSRVFVSGTSYASGSDDLVTVAYATRGGDPLWTRRIGGPDGDQVEPVSLAMSPDGWRVFVTGSREGGGTAYDFVTAAYGTRTGRALWTRRYDGPAGSNDFPISLAASPDGSRVFVMGWSRGMRPHDYFAIVAYSTRTGAGIWVRRNPRSTRRIDASAMAMSRDGSRLYVTGSSRGGGTGSDFITLAFRASTGTPVWTSRYSGPADVDDIDGAYAVAVSPGGSRIFVTGRSLGNGTGADYATVAYRA